MTKYDSVESDHSISEDPSSVPIDKEQTSLEEHEEPPSTRSANDKIPRGFSETILSDVREWRPGLIYARWQLGGAVCHC